LISRRLWARLTLGRRINVLGQRRSGRGKFLAAHFAANDCPSIRSARCAGVTAVYALCGCRQGRYGGPSSSSINLPACAERAVINPALWLSLVAALTGSQSPGGRPPFSPQVPCSRGVRFPIWRNTGIDSPEFGCLASEAGVYKPPAEQRNQIAAV